MSTSWLIGSGAGCTIKVDHVTVSGRHCRLTLDEAGFLLEDLGSTNGTFLNGKRLSAPARVTRQDTVTLGPSVAMPWPAEGNGGGTAPVVRTLRIGRELDNDVVVNVPSVSGHHARAVWDGKSGELVVEDLGSANGTAVGSPEKRVTRATVTASDTLYLGTHAFSVAQLYARLGLESSAALVFRGEPLVIGRTPGCGQTIDDASVSGRHARLFRDGGGVMVEDLGSTNGTFVNGRRIDRVQMVRTGDEITFGNCTLTFNDPSGPAPTAPLDPVVAPVAPQTTGVPTPTATLSMSRVSTLASPIPPPPALAASAPTREAELARELFALLRRPWVVAVLVVQAPLIAIGIVLVMNQGGGPSALGAVLFGLGLASLWFGLSNAALLSTVQGKEPGTFGLSAPPALLTVRFGLPLLLCLFQCVVAWITVASGAGLKGAGPAMLALLFVASMVGLALGLMIVLLCPRPGIARAVLAGAILPLWLFGGQSWPLPEMPSWTRVLANAVPSRWVFEGLLLLESERRPDTARPATADDVDPGPTRPTPSAIETYFPAESERMGLKADATALGGMLVGLLAAAGFMATEPKPRAS